MSEIVSPVLARHRDDGRGAARDVLLWRFADPVRSISSGVSGGGIGPCRWVLNAEVALSYARRDPDRHIEEIVAQLGLVAGAGTGMLTAAQVAGVRCGEDAGVRCDATVGLSVPIWAAAPDGAGLEQGRWRPGTINLVCQIPVALTDAALVNAVMTATEAKTQALIQAGVPGTGTASDAVVVCCLPGNRPERFAGPRSRWGARLARAVCAAVLAGVAPADAC